MLRVAIALIGTVILGIISRKVHLGFWLFDKSLGDLLYVMAAYLAIVIVTGWPSRRAAPLALVVAVSVECFKLTGLPMAWRGFWLSRWVLGSTFSWHNIGCYGLGVILISAFDQYLLRPHRTAS